MLRNIFGGRKSSVAARGEQADSPTKKKDTPLHAAIRNGDLKEAKRLLDHESAAQVDSLGRTCVHLACEVGDPEIIKLVLKKVDRAAVNATDRLGNTPLMVAVENGKRKAAELLLKAGAQTSSANAAGNTVLHLPLEAPFISEGHLKALKLMLGAPIVEVNRVSGDS